MLSILGIDVGGADQVGAGSHVDGELVFVLQLVAGERGIEQMRRSAGGPLRNTNFRSRVFEPAAASVGLAGVTPHDLRHTAASLAVAAGANVKAVQRMLGTLRRR